MTHVHYKFSSKLSSDTAVFDDTRITLLELKRQIMGREKLRAADCDLRITNAQTKEEYTDDEGLIPKGSSVIVRRIPIIGVKSGSNSKTRHIEQSDGQPHHAIGAIKAMANLAEADVSEEEKINIIVAQASMSRTKNAVAVLPANYTCYRCGDAGHHIRNCPTAGGRADHQDKGFGAPLRLKKSTGIPRSFMVEVDDPSVKGAMLTNCGHYAIPAMHAKAYAIGKKERPPFIPPEQPKPIEKKESVPAEVLCPICNDLLSDAVVIPCCGNSYCDDCIRTALLDSEEHVCPTCNKSHVSPDTLIANKFLRQAVNAFEKERGQAKGLQGSCGTSQPPNPTPTPLSVQSHPQNAHQSAHSLQAADTPPPSQVCGAPTIATGSTPASKDTSTSLQTVQDSQETSFKEAEVKPRDDSAPAALPVLASNQDPPAAAAQLMPLANPPAVDQSQTASMNPQQCSSSHVPGLPSTYWESSSFSPSGGPTVGWSKSNNQQFPPFPSAPPYPAGPPPLFLSPHFHTFLAAQQPLNSIAPGYQPPTPVWTFQTPHGAHVPTLCPSASASPIPTLLTKEWCMYQREKNERSPHRRYSNRRSSSRSKSKSSKSRSSRSYSRSSSRSRSRSWSKGRSRPHSPDPCHRDLHTRSHSSHSNTYGYKRSPTPSSSSSPRVGYHSSSKSSSDRRKTSHHVRHYSKKSASSRHSSRRRGESSQREAGSSGTSSASYLYDQHASKTSSPEMDSQRYLQWKREYKEWYEKYYSSYVGHFSQLPPSSPLPQGLDREGSRNQSHANSESRSYLQGRHTAWIDGRSPPSQSSSDSRSPPSHPSSERRSMPSQSSRDRRSSQSHLYNDSHSPLSQSSSDSCSAPSRHKDQLRAYHSHRPITLAKESREAELQESRRGDEQPVTKKSGNLRPLKYDQKSLKRDEEEIEEESSSPDAADSRHDKRKHSTGTNICKDGNPVQSSEALELIQPIVNPDKRVEKDLERKIRGERNLKIEKGLRRSKYSDSKHDGERRSKDTSSKGAGRVETGRDRHSGGSKAFDSGSANRKRKGEELERNTVEKSCKFLKANISESPETGKIESQNTFERKKVKTEKTKESKACPLTTRDIWEGEIKVKPQKKINININMDGKRMEEKTEKQDLTESITGKSKEEMRKGSNGEEENRGGLEVNDMKESSNIQEDESKETMKPDEREALVWKKATFRDHVERDREGGDSELWNCAHRTLEEQEMGSKKQWRECEGTRASKEDDVEAERSGVRGGREEGRKVMNDTRGQAAGGLLAGNQKEKGEEEKVCKENRGVSSGETKATVEPIEGEKWRMMMMAEEDVRSKSQRSRKESHDESSREDHQERTMVVKTGEELSQERATGIEDECVLIQVPCPKREKEDEEEFKGQMDDGEIDREMESKRQIQAMDRGWESSHRSVAPSSGRDRPDMMSSMTREGEGEKRTEMDRGRGGERARKEQREGKRTKERAREDEKGRSRRREGESSNKASFEKKSSPSSSHSYFYLASHETEGSGRQGGDGQGSNKSSCNPGGKSLCCSGWESSTVRERPDGKTQQTSSDVFLGLEITDKDPSHSRHRDSSGNLRDQHRPTGTHHYPPPPSQSRARERGLPSRFSGGSELSKPSMSSPGRGSMPDRSENVSRGEKERCRQRVDRLMKEGQGEQGEVDELDGRTEWEGGRELEEGERSSSKSVGSSASQEGSSDDGSRECEMKRMTDRKERRRAAEALEGGEPKHKPEVKGRAVE